MLFEYFSVLGNAHGKYAKYFPAEAVLEGFPFHERFNLDPAKDKNDTTSMIVNGATQAQRNLVADQITSQRFLKLGHNSPRSLREPWEDNHQEVGSGCSLFLG